MRHTVRSHRYLLLTMAVPQFPLAVFVADENGNPIPKATVQIWVKDQCLAQITKTAKDDKDAYRTTLPSGIPPFDLRVVTGNRLIYEKKNLRPDIGRVIFPEITVKKHVVILVHGIRDFALWQTTVGSTLEQEGFKVEATNYGRFNLLEFLAPFSYFRRKAIATVWNQIRIVKQNNEESPLSVIAHSFGTFVVAHLMQQEFDIKFNRVIFCGSVVRYGFPFEQFQDRFAQPIINEVGTRDIWPALAESVTIGYGSAGTYGFRRPLVKDRWHNGAHHGFFLDAEFCRKFWTPLLRDGTFVAGAAAPEKPRLWLQFLSVIKIKYVLVAAGLLLAICARERIATFAERLMGWSGSARIGVPDPQSIGTVQDLAVALKRIEDRKAVLNRDEIKQISADLTGTLIPSDSAIPRVTRRYMNEKIVGTIVFLNDRDLSHAWRALPRNLDLAYLDLSRLNLRGIRFDRTFLIHTDFSDSKLDDVVFDDAYVRNVDFSGASLSNILFVRTDWFNALNLPSIAAGQPIPYSEWMSCPEGHKSIDHPRPFVELLEQWYPIKFNQLKPDEALELVDSWKIYARENGLCDVVLRRP